MDLTTIPEARRILLVVSHFNLSVLATEMLSVSLCREIDNVFGAVRTCFDHVLSKFSGFSWERILFLNSACVNMVRQIQVQIGDTRRVFFMNPPGSVEDLKNYSLRDIPKTRFMDFGLLYENDTGEYVALNDVRIADIRLASLLYLLVYVSTYCVPIAHSPQNKPFPLLCLGHAQIIMTLKYQKKKIPKHTKREREQKK